MKKALFFLGMIAFTISSFAARESVLVKSFSYNTNVGETYAVSVRHKVMEGINKKGRIKVLDSATDDGVEADYILDGQVISISTTRGSDEKGSTYSSKIVYQLKVTKKSDNEVISNKSFETSSLTFLSIYRTETDAINSAVKYIDSQMEDFVDEVFKSTGKIIEVAETKKDEAKKVYISLGTDDGITKGQKLDVLVEKSVAGRKINKVIGEIKVEAVEGVDISLCKVTKEGKAIQAAMLENPDAVSVITKVNKNILGI